LRLFKTTQKRKDENAQRLQGIHHERECRGHGGGIIIGAAFSPIIASLVKDVIMRQ